MDIKQAFDELAEEVKKLIRIRIRKYGINPKTNTNTLQGSELEKSINVDVLDNGISLQIADYWEYVSLGWHRTGRFPNTMAAFLKNIDDWVRRKGIRLGNLKQSELVFLIVRNIINKGLRERPFMVYDQEGDLTKMIPELDEYIDKWFDTLFEAIMSDIDNWFNN